MEESFFSDQEFCSYFVYMLHAGPISMHMIVVCVCVCVRNLILTLEITGTGTLRVNRRGIPTEVKELKSSLEKGKNAPRGTGYYLCEEGSQVVYVCWQDRRCVLLASTAYPGHSEGTVARKLLLKHTINTWVE